MHWRPAQATYDRYGFCKPAIVLYVPDETNNILALHVLGSLGGLDPFQDKVPTGIASGQWHYIVDCPYDFSNPTSLVATAAARSNGYITAKEIQYVRQAV